MRYAECLEQKCQEKLINEWQIHSKKIKTLEKSVAKFLDEEFLSNTRKAEKKNNINYVVKGNDLKRKSTEKKAEIKSLEKSFLVLHEKRKKLLLKSIDTYFS